MSDLINVLAKSFYDTDSDEIKELKQKVLISEYEHELKKAGFCLSKIYKTKDNRWKVSSPIQLCRTNRTDCLKLLYEYFYGKLEKTLGDVYQLWINSFTHLVHQGHRSSITLDSYIGYYKKYVSNTPLSNTVISKIKPLTLYNFYANSAAHGNMTRKALNNLKSLINHIFEYAILNEYAQTNVAKLVSTKDLVLADQDDSKKVYSHAERIKIMKMLREHRNDPYANALTVLFCSGMRSGEIRALKWEDIDFEKKTIYVHREMVRRRNSAGRIEQVCLNHTKAKKMEGNRFIPITRDALEALKEQRELNPDGEFIFMIDGHIFNQNSLNVALKKYCNKTGVDYLSCHKMRFWTVTAMYAAGIPQPIIQRSVGHLSPVTTDHYKRVGKTDSISLQAAEAICNINDISIFDRVKQIFQKIIKGKQTTACVLNNSCLH